MQSPQSYLGWYACKWTHLYVHALLPHEHGAFEVEVAFKAQRRKFRTMHILILKKSSGHLWSSALGQQMLALLAVCHAYVHACAQEQASHVGLMLQGPSRSDQYFINCSFNSNIMSEQVLIMHARQHQSQRALSTPQRCGRFELTTMQKLTLQF